MANHSKRNKIVSIHPSFPWTTIAARWLIGIGIGVAVTCSAVFLHQKPQATPISHQVTVICPSGCH